MKFLRYNIDKVYERINNPNLVLTCRKNQKDFTRIRKSTPVDLIMYTLNNRGLSSKMELYDFNQLTNKLNMSTPAVLKQREKLNEDVFIELTKASLYDFYSEFKNEVKTFKGYLLLSIDGSDCEVPNTKETRERYKALKSKNENKIARIKLSNCYDVLNNYVLDTRIERYKYNEKEIAKEHIDNTEFVRDNFKSIYIMDRGYVSLSNFYFYVKNNVKFITRLDNRSFKVERNEMKSDDEIVEIKYSYDRFKYIEKNDKELHDLYMNNNTLEFRIVNIELPSGEVETLLTNLSLEEFSIKELYELYGKRWGIETSYHKLKESMKVTNISSSKDGIIKQEIYSQMFVYNIIASIENDLENNIEQKKYKNKQKVNFNIAVGFVKRFFIKILIEDDNKKREALSKELFNNIIENIVPIRKNRSYKRNKYNNGSYNKYPINKRKSY